MYTPYDWQEGIGNRASYIEGKLAQGAPVLAVSLDAGILVFTFRRQARKIYEIYDRLIFAAIGQQSDVEAIRTAALEFAHREGYNRSEQDVNVQRVATALSEPMKKSFGDFGAAPFVVRCLFGEVGEHPDADLYYTLDYDGDYGVTRRFVAIAGSQEASDTFADRLRGIPTETSPEDAISVLEKAWIAVQDPERNQGDELLQGFSREAVLLERSSARENRFRLLTPEEF